MTDNNGLKILVIHPLEGQPDEDAFRKLIEDAGHKSASVVFVAPSDVTSCKVNPADFDEVISYLGAGLADDEDLENASLQVVRSGRFLVGLWPQDSSGDEKHAAVSKYGKGQVPWDSEKVAVVLNTPLPQPFQSASGDDVEMHHIKPNVC